MLLGIIESTAESSNQSQFITLTKELCPPGKLVNAENTFKFSFNNVEKSYESYRGVEMNVKYILKVTFPVHTPLVLYLLLSSSKRR